MGHVLERSHLLFGASPGAGREASSASTSVGGNVERGKRSMIGEGIGPPDSDGIRPVSARLALSIRRPNTDDAGEASRDCS